MLIVLLVYLLFAVLIGAMAASRNRSAIGWVFVAILTSPLLAAILLIVLGPGRDER